MRIELTSAFTTLTVSEGTLQNVSRLAQIEVSSAQTENTGIVLNPGDILQFKSDVTLYARAVWKNAEPTEKVFLAHEPFNGKGEGGDKDISQVPVGTIFPYAGTTQPPGALLCDSAAVSRTMYPDLFDEIGTKYGAGDGTTTFNLPNLLDAALMNGENTKTAYETAGSATFIAPKTGWYKITVKGGGGGGQGGGYSTTYSLGGKGGGEGGTTIGYEKMTAGQTAAVVIGAGGAGGAANTSGQGAAGSVGGQSGVTVNNGHTYTANGGSGAGTGGSGTIHGAAGSLSGYAATNATSEGGSGGGSGGGRGGIPGTAGGGGGGGSARQSSSTANNGAAGGDGYAWIEYIGASEPYFIQAFTASTDPALVDLTQIAQDLAHRLTREQTPAFNKRDVITTSGTYTAPVTGWYKITVKGGGGGGGGGDLKSNIAHGGFGGGEGGTTIAYERMTAGQTASVVIGAGGAGGAAGNVYGGNGGDSTVTVNGNTYTGGGASAATGGTGTIRGNDGGNGTFTTTPSSINAVGGTRGGENGGIGGRVNAVGQQAGGAGGDGFVWFEYWDPSLQ